MHVRPQFFMPFFLMYATASVVDASNLNTSLTRPLISWKIVEITT